MTLFNFRILFFCFTFTLPVYSADLPSGFADPISPGKLEEEDESSKDPWTELSRHVVLTHAMGGDTFTGLFNADPTIAERCDLDNPDPVVIQNILASDGTLGTHLSVADVRNPFPQRPHIHWAWNQLVQSHVNGSWENSFLCVLEPMTEVDTNGNIFGIAPYDTFSFGSHTLSPRSMIVVREDLAETAQQHLKDYKGTIASYPRTKTCRNAIIDALKQHFPEVWHVATKDGREVGKTAKKTGAGYLSTTNLKRADRSVVQIISKSGSTQHPRDDAAVTSARSHKFVGLHMNAPTYRLENDPCLKALSATSVTKRNVDDNQYCVTDAISAWNFDKLAVAKASDVYKQTTAYNNRAATNFMQRYLHKALFMDYLSLNKEAPNEKIAALFNNQNDPMLQHLERRALSIYEAKHQRTLISSKNHILRNICSTIHAPSKLRQYKDALKAVSTFIKKRPQKKEPDPRIGLAQTYIDEKKYQDAFSVFENIIATEHNKSVVAEAQLGMAHLLETESTDLTLDRQRAFSLYKKVYKQTDNLAARAEAMFWIGRYLCYGYHDTINTKLAFMLFGYAARQRDNRSINAQALVEMIKLLQMGRGCVKDTKGAHDIAAGLAKLHAHPLEQAYGNFLTGYDIEAQAKTIHELNEARNALTRAAEQNENKDVKTVACIKLGLLHRQHPELDMPDTNGCESINWFMNAYPKNNRLGRIITHYHLKPNNKYPKIKLLTELQSLSISDLAHFSLDIDVLGLAPLRKDIIALIAEKLLSGSCLRKFEQDQLFFDRLLLSVDIKTEIVQYIKEKGLGWYNCLTNPSDQLTLKQILFLARCSSYKIVTQIPFFSRIIVGPTFLYLNNSKAHLWSLFISLPTSTQRLLSELNMVGYKQRGIPKQFPYNEH